VIVAPPMYRTTPVWYRDGLPEILTKFSSMMTSPEAPKMRLLPSFSTPEFDSDGIHLTPYSGLAYVLHLFDSATSILSATEDSEDCDQRFVTQSEASRLLEDRVTVLEQDHKRLNRSVEYRAAVDAELHDYQENIGYEEFFIMSGKFERPRSSISGKEWQASAIKILQTYMVPLLGRPASIEFVQNITGRSKDSMPRYQVKVATASESREVRTKFGKFFVGGNDDRPELFKRDEISIRNRVTQDTRVRIAILQVIAKRYRDSNKGSKSSVIGYEPRPVLRITPPSSVGSDRRSKSYYFVEAVKSFPTNFSEKDLSHILSKVGPRSFGKLRSTFICLSDDLRRPPRPGSRAAESDPMDLGDVEERDHRDEREDRHSASSDWSEVRHGRGSKRGPSPSSSARTEKSSRH